EFLATVDAVFHVKHLSSDPLSLVLSTVLTGCGDFRGPRTAGALLWERIDRFPQVPVLSYCAALIRGGVGENSVVSQHLDNRRNYIVCAVLLVRLFLDRRPAVPMAPRCAGT